jgi:hypothetical protein
VIPAFNDKGCLPPGIHDASWDEFNERFATTPHRRQLVMLMAGLIRHLKSVGCAALYVDGSFVTSKDRPNDYDACWDVSGVKAERVDPDLLQFDHAAKARTAERYGGDIRPDVFSPTEMDATYLQFFQIDRDGDSKGIVKLRLAEIEP